MKQHVPDRPHSEHPDVAGETQRWCSVCERIGEDCICDDSVRSSASVEGGKQKGQAAWKCASSEDHEYDICTGPPDDSRLGKLICNFCGELAPSQPEPENSVAVNVGAGRGVPADAIESLLDWYDERNQLQNERDAEEREWARQQQLQEETDDR